MVDGYDIFAAADCLATDLAGMKQDLEDLDVLPELRAKLQSALDEITACAPAIRELATNDKEPEA
jgi:hypothetical protein